MLNYFTFNNRGLTLYFSNGRTREVDFLPNSGRIVWRNKVGGGVKHTGIKLGRDQRTGKILYIHNHPLKEKATIVSENEFASGNRIFYQKGSCINPPQEVIAKGLEQVINQTEYRALSSNCQHLANKACMNQNRSQGVEAGLLALGIGIGIFCLGGLTLAASDKENC